MGSRHSSACHANRQCLAPVVNIAVCRRIGGLSQACSRNDRSLHDHCVRAQQQQRWDCQAERLGLEMNGLATVAPSVGLRIGRQFANGDLCGMGIWALGGASHWERVADIAI